ncbi:MAG: DoxX family protein [Sphingobacteriia bacterium]|nr:DoxX family protein [Sphingobacteriia bacterium]
MQILTLYKRYVKITDNLKSISLLLIRLVLAYGFYQPAVMKVKDIHAIGDWFKELGMPFPYINAYAATFTELAGFVLIGLGFGTRIIALPMMVVMLVAIKTVHWANGFEASNNGFEIPLYYLLMLFLLICSGAGKISIDFVIFQYQKAKKD